MFSRLLTLFLLSSLSTFSFGQDTSIVYFDFDKYDLNPGAIPVLEQIIQKQGFYGAKIYGHTDQLGTIEYNNRLSVRRASSVKDYFVAKGVDPSRIMLLEGYGETTPVAARLDAASRQKNRRVVIISYYEVRSKDSSIMEDAPKKDATPVTETPREQTNTRKTVKEDLVKEITDTSTKAGDNLILQNINFYGGRHVFLPEAYPPLQELLHTMETIPTLEIEIQGHICCREDESDGLDIDTGEPFLSHNRAKAVFQYLVSRGIDPKRMTYKGFGHKYPIIAFESNEQERTTNRRVEIKILKK